jgi:mono/diheme cytochrome c family protein
VIKALDDASRDVRVSALRLSERWLDGNPEVQAAVVKKIDDQNWAVREQLAATLGALPPGLRDTAIAMLLERHADDAIVMDAAASGLRGRETAVIERLMHAEAQTPMLENAMTVLSATAIRGGEEAASRSIFDWAADTSHPQWQRSAILRGAEAALLGAVLPGTAAGRGRGAGNAAAASCPTCPGARGGPGGAPAFPTGRAANAPPAAGGRAGGRGSGGPVLRLPAEPAALVALAGTSGDLGARATRVLARVEWPGKPGAAAPVAPLTPEQQVWFTAGETVFKNLCQACHQADGRGQDKVAATLVGSAFALGPPEIGARILLNGKEGKIGLMPRAHLRAASMGKRGNGGRSSHRQASPSADGEPQQALDGRGVERVAEVRPPAALFPADAREQHRPERKPGPDVGHVQVIADQAQKRPASPVLYMACCVAKIPQVLSPLHVRQPPDRLVGHAQQHAVAADPRELGHRDVWPLDVFEHLAAEHEVEAARGKRQVVDRTLHERNGILRLRHAQPGAVHVQPDDADAAKAAIEMAQDDPLAASDIQQPARPGLLHERGDVPEIDAIQVLNDAVVRRVLRLLVDLDVIQ